MGLRVEAEIHDPRFTDLIDAGNEPERLSTGFQVLEGPVGNPRDEYPIFSEIPGDRLYRWSASAGLSLFRIPSHKANGNASDKKGRLLTCQHAGRCIRRQEPDGSPSALPSHYEGYESNSPHDLVAKSDGG